MPALVTPIDTTCGPLKIKEWPATDRPRERLRTLGPQSLSSRELLALLIETGVPAADGRPARSALDVAGDLMAWALQGEEETGARDRQPLRRILNATLTQLCSVPGIGPAKAAKIQAALDLGRRVHHESRHEVPRLTCARDVFEHLSDRLRDLRHEEFHVVLLTAQNELLGIERVAQGSVDNCAVAPRDVFRPALREGAHSVVAVHNHPSGEPRPSPEDAALTQRLQAAAATLGVRFLDHVIIGEQRYWSFFESSGKTPGW